MKKIIKIAACLFFSLLMAGCGGGGGSAAPPHPDTADTTPPYVVSAFPLDVPNVPINTAVSATFNEAMDVSTVNTSTFTLKDSGNNPISGVVVYSATTATFTPSSNLAYSTTYTVAITTGVKDQAGNAMTANYTCSFATGQAPDTTPPMVSSTIPGNGTSEIIRNTPISATFSEPVDCTTVTTNSIYLSNGATGTINCSGTTATFTPSSLLAANTLYTITITKGVKDLAGNAMVADFTGTITTGSSLAWAKSYAFGYVRSVYQTSDGGYIVAGYSTAVTYTYAYWIIKVDIQGNIQWQKAYDGMGDFAESIQQTADGGFIVAGYSWNYGTAGAQGTWILKLDSSGTPLWQKSYSTEATAPRAYVIRQTTDGGYIVAGEYSRSTGSDMWVMKLDSLGLITWQKRYGGGLVEVASSIEQTVDGGYIVAGSWSWPTLGSDASVLKLDANGDIAWQMSYGVLNRDDKAASIKQTSDGGYIAAGHTNSAGAGGLDVWTLKLDASGNIVWQKTYGGSLDDGAYSIQQASDGSYIVAGYTYSSGAGGSDVWALKLDTSGNIVWQKTYGGSQNDANIVTIASGDFIRQTTDGGYILAANPDSHSVWLLKITSSGFIGFNPQSTAVSTDTTVVAVGSTANVGVTAYTATNTAVSIANTTCPITDTTATVQQQAP